MDKPRPKPPLRVVSVAAARRHPQLLYAGALRVEDRLLLDRRGGRRRPESKL